MLLHFIIKIYKQANLAKIDRIGRYEYLKDKNFDKILRILECFTVNMNIHMQMFGT